MQLVSVANHLEHVAEVIGSHMVSSTRKRMDEGARISPDSAKRLNAYCDTVARALEGAVESVVTENVETAHAVRDMKDKVFDMSRYISRTRFERTKSAEGAIGRYVREIELLELLDGIFKTARRIARTQIEQEEPDAAPAA